MNEREPARSNRFLDALRQRPLLLDAAMGTRLIARGLVLGHDDPCLWNLDRPDEVLGVHRLDVEAGADAVLTNTFGANRNMLVHYGREHDLIPINRDAVALAREAAGLDRFVIGCIGPMANQALNDSGEQAAILIDAGVDALVFETHDVSEALRALAAPLGGHSIVRLVSLRGETPPTPLDVQELIHQGARAIGTNCLLGVGPTSLWLERLPTLADFPLIVKPSAGLPGEPMEQPEAFAEAVPRWLALGVRLIGGCCGTTEAHVAALRAAIDRNDP
ncbi:MAG: homocysteine S-methyltransferase family protein [Isosphaeraceae bacterium]